MFAYTPGLRRLATVVFLAASSCVVGIAGANAQRVGESVVIQNEVSALGGGQQARLLSVSDPVNADETVSAGVDSHGELRLNDDSKVIVGPNSSISLDAFVVSQNNGFAQGTLKVTKGAFRFITGNSAKGTFKVETPLSTIGVRGTTFDIYVDGETGDTRVLLFQGQLRVCTTGGICKNVDRSCDIVEVRSPQEIAELPFLRSARRSRQQESSLFGLTDAQQRFQRDWRAPMVACNARAAQEAANTYGPIRGEGNQPDNSGRSAPAPAPQPDPEPPQPEPEPPQPEPEPPQPEPEPPEEPEEPEPERCGECDFYDFVDGTPQGGPAGRSADSDPLGGHR